MEPNKIVVIAGLSILMSACNSTPPLALPTYPSVNISAVDGYSINPASSLVDRILVVPGVKNSVPVPLQNSFADDVRNLVIDSGTEVIDRALAQRFIDEIHLKENLAEEYEPYEGPVEAKYLMIPTVTDYSWGSEYKKAYNSKTKDGDTIRHDPTCTYSSSVQGNVQIRVLPSMEQVVSINLQGKASSSQDNPSNSNCKESGIANGVVENAIFSMLEKGDDNYINLSKYVGSQGMIIGAKSVNKKLYFETSLGRVHGAKAEEPVAIYQRLDGELVKIASGKMVDRDNIYNNKSYITVDEKDADRIKKGMIVMLSGECKGWMCSIKHSMKKATSAF